MKRQRIQWATGVVMGMALWAAAPAARADTPAAGAAGNANAAAQPTSQPTSRPTTQPTTQPADKIEGMAEEWVAKLKEGGNTMWVLLALSILGVMFAVERVFMLRRGRIVPRGLSAKADRLWRHRKYDEIDKLLRRNKSTLSRVLAFVLQYRDAPVADVSTAAGDIASRELRRHLLRAYPLAVVATLAPLLGLLGTVIGMIDAFDTVVMVGMGDASALAYGISKALITTMAGLTIAIPALFAYHFFKSRTNLFGVMLEEEVTELISVWLMRKEALGAS